MLNFKTLYFNFKCLPFNQAIKLPFLINNKVWIKKLKGRIEINAPIKSGMIRIGFGDVAIFDKHKSRSILELNGKIIFRGVANIGHGSKISVLDKGVLEIVNNFQITAETAIVCEKSIVFGDDILISWDNLFMDTDFHSIYNQEGNVINQSKQVIIGNNVWVGCRCTILKGSIIPNDSVIAAGSLVTGEHIDKNSIYGGNPAKKLLDNISWKH